MTLSHPNRSPTSFFMFMAATAALSSACELPAKLGELPDDAASAGSSSSASTGEHEEGSSGGVEPTTGEAPLCTAQGGVGALLWSRERDEVPDFFTGLAATPGGDVAAVGKTAKDVLSSDAMVQVYDPAGAPLWTRSYFGPKDLDEWAVDVAVDGAGFVHVLVYETVLAVDEELSGYRDARFVVLRYTPDGELVWRWVHERPPVLPGETYTPLGTIAAVGERIVLLEGSPNEAATRSELDAGGALIAEATLALPAGADPWKFAVDPDGSAALAGEIGDNEQRHLWVGRFAVDGSLEWLDEIGDPNDHAELVLADGVGGVYLAWQTNSLGPTEHRLRRYGPAGAAVWTTTLPMTAVESGVQDGVVRCDGALVLTGGRDKPATPDLEWDQRQDLWVARVDADGAVVSQLEHFFGPPFGFGEGVRVAATVDGELAVAGNFLDSNGEPAPWFGRLGQ